MTGSLAGLGAGAFPVGACEGRREAAASRRPLRRILAREDARRVSVRKARTVEQARRIARAARRA